MSNNVKPPTIGDKMIGAGFKAIDKGTKLMSIANKRQTVTDNTSAVVSSAMKGVTDNQWHQKLSSENEENDTKPKKKSYAKYVPALAGAVLLASAGKSIIKSGDVTKPVQDMRDGVMRVPAAVFNKVTSKIKHPVKRGIADGMREGVKKSVKKAKPKVNRSPMGEIGLGLARGTGQLIPFIAGAKYLEYKAKKDNKQQKELLDTYKSAHPVANAAVSVAKVTPTVVNAAKTAVAEQKKKEEKGNE